ncbi:MAG: flavodoxin family protein [Thermodesulfobacteriota bacterium]|jgi:multimeric flavodoxin WrbA|nr:MAG: flavodoxin family protein [Thermodesulfobacteriota bacterium]
MKVIAFNSSPRKEGNTNRLINIVFAELEKEGIETEKVWIGGGKIQGCISCRKCIDNKDKRCSVKKDKLNDYIKKMVEAEGIILGSPTYFGSVSAEMKMLIDRAGMVSKANGYLLRRKVGAAVIAARRGGASDTFNTINHFFFLNQMIVPGSIYWNFAFGLHAGEVEKDEEGIMTMKVLGENIAWCLKKFHS